MAVIDLVKFGGDKDALAWKFPGDELSTMTQVVVNQSQEALLFKGGQALDVLGPGTHTLATGNIPLVSRLLNLPFGGESPFTAEIWYVDKTVRRHLRWGTQSPIPIFDPIYQRPVNVRAHGGWGMRVVEARPFITQLVGLNARTDPDLIYDYFISEIHQRLVTKVGKFFKAISVLMASAHLTELSNQVQEALSESFARYGMEVTNFNIVNLSLPPDEMKALQEKLDQGLGEAVRLGRLTAATGVDGDKMYGTMRSFDTLEKAADNESGAAGAMMSTGLGAGVGLGVGAALGQNINLATNVETSRPSAHSGSQTKGTIAERLGKLKELQALGLISEEDFAAKKQQILDEI